MRKAGGVFNDNTLLRHHGHNKDEIHTYVLGSKNDSAHGVGYGNGDSGGSSFGSGTGSGLGFGYGKGCGSGDGAGYGNSNGAGYGTSGRICSVILQSSK